MSNKALDEWDLAAYEYSKSQENSAYSKFNKDFIKAIFQNVANQKVLDAGCGDGCYTSFFCEKGANVIGCDGSISMINIAKSKYPFCNFALVDLQQNLPYESECFDLVFSNLVLMDIENIDTLVKEFERILKVSGKLFISIVHPAFFLGDWEKDSIGNKLSKKVEKYITVHSANNDFWGTTRHYHRPISFYFNKFFDCGFSLKKMYEPQVYERNGAAAEIPLFLFAEFNKFIKQ